MSLSLLSTTSRVETPFITVTIAGYSFGVYSRKHKHIINSSGNFSEVAVDYPNYMKSLTVDKVNGTVNTYTLTMQYAIREGNDPNLLEKIFSKAQENREIVLSYGDLSTPSFIYRQEEAFITDIKSNININASLITYTITCISKSLALAAGTYSFPKVYAKPSDIIKKILYDTRYGLLEVFYGMRNKEKVLTKGLIIGDDRPVTIEAKRNISIFNYLSYLVTCMSSIVDSENTLIKQNKYTLIVVDDITTDLSGPYFKISKVASNINENTLDTYELDIGYPGKNVVIDFALDDNQTWSLLYKYSGEVEQPSYVYRINNQGNIESEYSPTLAKSNQLLKTTEVEKNWWTKVTQFPISGTLTLKGLLKPAILMTYIKLNVLFYGQKHVSSGYYVVTKQTDSIDESGYKTILKITRIKGDN